MKRQVYYYRAAPSYIAGGPWLAPNYADATVGDQIDGEDLQVRQAAVEALNGLNGSVVVADTRTGRILAMVNQKVALSPGYQPCSLIKVYAAAAGVSEGILKSETEYGSLDLTVAMARSSNGYFARLGLDMGYDNFAKHAKHLGIGERAGWNIEGERPGTILDQAPGANRGGMGMMTSFGEGVSLTPLQAAATMVAFANGGNLFYLQHPKTEGQLRNFQPKLKRKVEVDGVLAEIRDGMQAATVWGTGHKAGHALQEPVYGKTGTCTDRHSPTHMGWFGSFTRHSEKPLAVVVMLTGGSAVNGGRAADVAGGIYRRLYGTVDPSSIKQPVINGITDDEDDSDRDSDPKTGTNR